MLARAMIEHQNTTQYKLVGEINEGNECVLVSLNKMEEHVLHVYELY